MEFKQRGDEAIKDKSYLFGLMGSQPNFMIAAEEYEKAAGMFKHQKLFEKSFECYVLTGQCHQKLHAYFLAGKAFESAALLAEKYLNDPKRAADLFKLAADQSVLSNTPDKAIDLLVKAATVLEHVENSKSLLYYEQAMSLIEQEDRIRVSNSVFTKAIGFCIDQKLFKEAISISSKLEAHFQKLGNANQFRRQVVSSVLIYLRLQDEEKGLDLWNRACLSDPQLNTCDEGELIQELLQAFASCNQEDFEKVVNNNKLIPYLDNKVSKMAKEIIVSTKSSNKIASSNANLTKLQDQIEEDGYL